MFSVYFVVLSSVVLIKVFFLILCGRYGENPLLREKPLPLLGIEPLLLDLPVGGPSLYPLS
jgi:hypothetical protein